MDTIPQLANIVDLIIAHTVVRCDYLPTVTSNIDTFRQKGSRGDNNISLRGLRM